MTNRRARASFLTAFRRRFRRRRGYDFVLRRIEESGAASGAKDL